MKSENLIIVVFALFASHCIGWLHVDFVRNSASESDGQ